MNLTAQQRLYTSLFQLALFAVCTLVLYLYELDTAAAYFAGLLTLTVTRVGDLTGTVIAHRSGRDSFWSRRDRYESPRHREPTPARTPHALRREHVPPPEPLPTRAELLLEIDARLDRKDFTGAHTLAMSEDDPLLVRKVAEARDAFAAAEDDRPGRRDR